MKIVVDFLKFGTIMCVTNEKTHLLILKNRRKFTMYKLLMNCANILAMSDPAYVVCKRRNDL